MLPAITLSMVLRARAARSRLGARRWACTGWGSSSPPGSGPVVGGYLVEYVNWRLIFYINVPIGILGAVAAALVLPRVPRRVTGRRFDVAGLRSPSGGVAGRAAARDLEEGERVGLGDVRPDRRVCSRSTECMRTGAVRGDRAGGFRRAAAGRAGVPLVAVHQLAAC